MAYRGTASFLGAVLAAASALGGAGTVQADALPDFTGYTRPGVPSGKAAAHGGQIIFVADDGAKKQNALLGGTVYFTVVDTSLETEEKDAWRKMSQDLMRSFVPGKDSRGAASPAFDSGARYIYLYQTVNDMPNSRGAVRTSAVYLPDPELLSSWGHFPGHGFTAVLEKEDKEVIKPVSFTNAVDGENRAYHNPDTYYLTEKLLRIDRFPTRAAESDIRPAATGDDPVRNPNTVILTRWVGAPNRSYYGAGSASPWGSTWGRGPIFFPPRQAQGDRGFDNRRRDGERDRLQDANIKALWSEKNLLRPQERGALFGFTSDYPPVYDDVQLRGPRLKAPANVHPAEEENGIKPAANKSADNRGDVKPAAEDPAEVKPAAAAGTGAAPATGEVPVPVAGGTGAGGWTGGLATYGSLGGLGGGSSGGGGGPVGAGGIGFAPPATGSGGGGQTGGGGSQMGSGTNQGQNQPQAQLQSQSQSQTQQGGSGSGSGECGCEGNIVPEPPAWLMLLIGSPGVAWLWYVRRRGAFVGAAA